MSPVLRIEIVEYNLLHIFPVCKACTVVIKNEVESIVNEAVNKIYKQGEKVLAAFNWTGDSIKDQHGEGYHALAILDVMYPKLAPKEQKLLTMRIPCGDAMD